MSPPGRPKGEYRRAQPEGTPVSRSGAEDAAEFIGAPAPTDERVRGAPLRLITRLLKLLPAAAVRAVLDADVEDSRRQPRPAEAAPAGDREDPDPPGAGSPAFARGAGAPGGTASSRRSRIRAGRIRRSVRTMRLASETAGSGARIPGDAGLRLRTALIASK
jgi:hypothetical protein